MKSEKDQLSLVEFEVVINLTKSRVEYQVEQDWWEIEGEVEEIGMELRLGKFLGQWSMRMSRGAVSIGQR